MFTATTVPVRPCGTASPAWLPRPAHRATPALDALERDEEAWTERSVTAIRAGEGLPGLGYSADSAGNGGGNSNSSGGGGGDNSGGGGDHHHHRILGFSVRNPEDLGLDRTVPPPPPLHVSEARIAAAEAVEAMGPPLERSMSWEAREAERASRASPAGHGAGQRQRRHQQRWEQRRRCGSGHSRRRFPQGPAGRPGHNVVAQGRPGSQDRNGGGQEQHWQCGRRHVGADGRQRGGRPPAPVEEGPGNGRGFHHPRNQSADPVAEESGDDGGLGGGGASSSSESETAVAGRSGHDAGDGGGPSSR